MNNLEKRIVEEENIFFSERELLRRKEKEIINLKVTLREETISKQFIKFIGGQDKTVQDSVYLNNVLLHAAIVSYYYDIHRYKNFSGSEWVNNYKQAAYSIKWITKFRPIQIKENTKNVTDKLFDINLIFALVCGFSFLNREMVDLIMAEKQEIDAQNKSSLEKRTSFYDNLLYAIRYRPLSGKQLMLIFETLKLACE